MAWSRAGSARSDPRRGDQYELMPAFWVPWVLSGSRPVYGLGVHRSTGYSNPAGRPAGVASTRLMGRSYAFDFAVFWLPRAVSAWADLAFVTNLQSSVYSELVYYF